MSTGIQLLIRRARSTAPRLCRVLVMSLASLVLIAANMFSGMQPAHAQTIQSPQTMLLAYYSAIGLRNYAQAYSYWIAPKPSGTTPATPAQSYADFASGFLTTDHVDPYLGDWQPAPVNAPAGETGRLPAVLIGHHLDGTIESYSGCFAIGTSAATTWGIVVANFTLIGTAIPDSATILQGLQVQCYAAVSNVALTTTSKVSSLDDGQNLLTSYYKLINQRSYADAYALWLHPQPGPKPNGAPPVDYRIPYADFVAGYGTTAYVFGFYGQYTASGGFAGHGYITGTIPVVLIGYHTDGSVNAAYGCYVLGGLSNGPKGLGIVSGSLKAFPAAALTSGVPNGQAISTELALDCTTLPLQF